MTIQIRNDEEARIVARAVLDQAIPEDRQAEVLTALRDYERSTQLPEFPEGEAPDTREGFGGNRRQQAVSGALNVAGDVGQDLVAAGEVALTTATAGLGEIVGGFNAALGTVLGSRSVEEANLDLEATSDAFTFAPRTERGQKLLQDIAPPLMALEEGADRVSEKLGMGNPIASTVIKTALLGGAELAIPSKKATGTIAAKRKIGARQREIQKIANDLGINVDHENFAQSIVEAAHRMTPEERAQNAPALQQALREAADFESARRSDLFDQARASRTFVETDSVRDLSDAIRADLVNDGFDLDEMPIVQKRLDDMKSDTFAEGVAAASRLNELEKVRRRINANRSSSPSENAALNRVKRDMDRFLDDEFNKIATEQGSIPRGEGAISGDTAGLQAWKDARLANVRWKQNFSEDKAIAQLIQKESTPEQYRQWLVGATAMGARKEAASTIRRMKGVLGDQHPAIEGIRQDFLFEIAEPLLKEEPNFRQFVRNYDAIVRRNPSLVKELDLSRSDMNDLYNFARAQNRLPPNKRLASADDLTSGLARFFAGHKLARGQVRIGIVRNALNLAFGVDRVSQKQILAEVANAMQGEVAIPPRSALAAEFIAGAAITGLPDALQDKTTSELEKLVFRDR